MSAYSRYGNRNYKTKKHYSNHCNSFDSDEENSNVYERIGNRMCNNNSDCDDHDLFENPNVCLFRNKKGAKKGKICGSSNTLSESDYTRCRLHLDKY